MQIYYLSFIYSEDLVFTTQCVYSRGQLVSSTLTDIDWSSINSSVRPATQRQNLFSAYCINQGAKLSLEQP